MQTSTSYDYLYTADTDVGIIRFYLWVLLSVSAVIFFYSIYCWALPETALFICSFLLRDLACRDFAAQKDFSRKCGGFKFHFISGPGWDGIIAGGGHNLTGGMGGIFCCQPWRAGRILSDRASSSVLVIAYTSYFCTDEQCFNNWFDKRVISVDLWDWKNALLLAAEKISLSISQPLAH